MQSTVIEKGLKMKHFRYTMADIIVGCIVTVVVAFFIMVACGSTLYPNGIVINEAKDAALSLVRWPGTWHPRSLLSDYSLHQFSRRQYYHLATAYFVCEAFGFEAGMDKKWDEAKEFYVLYTGIIVISVIIILIPKCTSYSHFNLVTGHKRDSSAGCPCKYDDPDK